jgi:sarcosine oxidase subunit beta
VRTIGAMHTTRGGHANPQRTAQAYAWAFLDRGGEIRAQCAVLEILAAAGHISGVKTAAGELSAPRVVCCAGPQARRLCGPLGVELPLAIARLEACISAPLPSLFDVAMVGNGLSVRQTRRGNLHFNGGPHEWVDVDLCSEPAKPNTPNLCGAARRLAELFPDLGATPLLRTWAGVVEVTPDHATLIENVAEPEGLIVVSASGHGFGLAPAIGKVVGELATSGHSSIPIEGLGLSRFRDLATDWRETRQWTAGNYNT